MSATKAPHLSAMAQKAAGWLSLFRDGVFEDNFLDVSGMDAGAWEAACAELEAATLVTVDREVLLAGRPYLRLPEGKEPAEGAVAAQVRARYVGVYRAMMMAVRQLFHGPNPRQGLEILAREEANFRRAVGWARELGDQAKASEMGDLFTRYLERAGRSEDRDQWVAWLASEGREEKAEAPVEKAETAEAPVEKAAPPAEATATPEPVPAASAALAAPTALTAPALVMQPEPAASASTGPVEVEQEKESEGARLQREGAEAVEEGDIARAAELYQRALRWFQDGRDEAGVAQTCHLFGQMEEAAGRPEGARVWHERAEAVATRRRGGG